MRPLRTGRRCGHRAQALATAVVVGVLLSACAVEEALPPPDCATGGSSLIVAQSVTTATQIPCFLPLPDGWSVASVSVNQDRSIVRFDSDRAGAGAAELRYEASCDTSDAVSAPSDLPAADRYDQIDRLDPSFRARRYYVFDGGCVWWSFDFDRDVSATQSVAIGNILALVSREDLNDDIRDTFIDEEL